MVSNFCEGFILVLFVSQKLIMQVKTTKFAVPMSTGEQIAFQFDTNSNCLAILASRVEAIASMNALGTRLISLAVPASFSPPYWNKELHR